MLSGRRRRLLAWTVALATVAVLLAVGLAGRGVALREAPALPREQLSGPGVTLPRLLAAGGPHPALVLFWASWCEPCQHEAAAVESFARSRAGRGRVVGVDWSDGLSGARAFVTRYRWSFPNVRDGEGAVGEAYGLTGLPTTFVLDAQGRIRATLRGPQTEASLIRALARA